MAATRDQSSRVGLWLFAIVSIVPADLVLRRFLWPATVVLHVAVALQLALALPLELLGYSVSRYFGKWLGVPVNCAGLVTVAATMLYVRPIALRANGMLKLQRSLRSGHSQWSGPATDECSHIDHSSNPLIEVPHWEWIVADLGSAIRKWTSDDGVTWQVACSGQPLIGPSGEAAAWDASYVFGFDTVRISELEVIVYYNARDGFFRGFERIGASRITIPLRKE
eukprot:TRINITY_DN16252_c0_g1_i2.p1 TRINITY_DN16252_c0_g1~~TRINITY_DN16252_c0_g1_i2.p1  ORF type:complete len:224 (+),score=23.57 TRINITY_DN16252_c0_g1_i2:266-937(+)